MGRKKKKKKKWTPGGDWRKEKVKGMPEITGVEKIPDDMMGVEEVRDYMSYEGIDALDFLPPDKIKDVKLRKLWEQAKEAIKEIRFYVY